MKISTSFLSCDDIKEAVNNLNFTDTDYIHVDFINGSFVKGKKIPFRKIKKVDKISNKRFDVHLMTNKLNKYIPKFSMLNCEYITFHIEAVKNILRYIKLIHSYNIKCGIAINPNTKIDVLEPYLDSIDLILVMGVEPGYGGQEFIDTTVDKIKDIKKLIKKSKKDILISVDGGINNLNINKIKKYVDIVVSGSFITNSNNYQEQINLLK